MGERTRAEPEFIEMEENHVPRPCGPQSMTAALGNDPVLTEAGGPLSLPFPVSLQIPLKDVSMRFKIRIPGG